MELIKDIYFNTDKLVENTNVKVSYTGKFYQGNNDKVYIHYGYGKNWDNVNDVQMKKTDLGYQTEINLAQADTLNFCFKNQNNEWDNNFGKNYIFNIEKASSNVQEKSSNPSFFGKTFETTDENSNVYWNTESNQNTVSGIIEDVQVSAPESVDAVINTTPNTFGTIETPVDNLGISLNSSSLNGVVETLDTNPLSNLAGVNTDTVLSNPVSLDTVATPVNSINETIINPFAQTQQPQVQESTAMIIVNNSLRRTRIWTKKLTNTVCKFFAKVPKFISGNYKRIVNKEN